MSQNVNADSENLLNAREHNPAAQVADITISGSYETYANWNGVGAVNEWGAVEESVTEGLSYFRDTAAMGADYEVLAGAIVD